MKVYNRRADEYIYGYLDYIEANPEEFNEDHRLLPSFIRKELKKPNVYIDYEKLDEIYEFYDKYLPFEFMPWQWFVVSFVFGVYQDYENGIMLFNRFFIYMGRGGGKNGFITALTLGLLSNKHGVRNYDMDIIANSEKQAKTSFEELYDWVDYDKRLTPAFYKTKSEIRFRSTNSSLGYRTSNPKTADGGRQGALVFDEIHYFENYDLINVYESGMGKKSKPKYFYISSDGYVRDGVLDDKKESGHNILAGVEEHNGMLYISFSLDDESEITDEKAWVKANPRIKYDKQFAHEFKNLFVQARKNEQQMAEFMTKRFNLPKLPESSTVATIEEIRQCNRDIPFEELKQVPCVGGIDFSSMKDFCSVGLLFKYDGVFYLIEHTFVHERSLVVEYKFPVREYAEKGGITIIKEADSPIITGEHVAEWFLSMINEGYMVTDIYADTFRLASLRDEFAMYGMEITEVRSGNITHSKLHPLFEAMFAEGRMVWGKDNRLMNWYTMNVMVETDKKGNKTYKKIEPIKRKTDGFFMLTHAMNHYIDSEYMDFIPYEEIDYGVF